MLKLILVLLITLPTISLAEYNLFDGEIDDSSRENAIDFERSTNVERRERIKEKLTEEIDDSRTLDRGDPCLIESTLPGCDSNI